VLNLLLIESPAIVMSALILMRKLLNYTKPLKDKAISPSYGSRLKMQRLTDRRRRMLLCRFNSSFNISYHLDNPANMRTESIKFDIKFDMYLIEPDSPAIMSKRPSSSAGGPNRKKSSFRFARDPSGVVANSTKVQLASGRVKRTKQNMITGQAEPASVSQLEDQPLQLDDPNGTDAVQVDMITPDILPEKSKRKKRTNTTSASSILICHVL
jgi:hypothetical protein